MRLRRADSEWLEVMESWIAQTVKYVTENDLWAHQGGPVILSQIENELDGKDDQDDQSLFVQNDNLLFVNRSSGSFVDLTRGTVGTAIEYHLRKATIQDYADWCGKIAEKYAPNVTWTMCNGLTANNTIHTCNAVDTGAEWLERYGENGRIQVDQPPIFTEFEEGFQVWGETVDHPNDYFWGRTARSAAREALRWFARG